MYLHTEVAAYVTLPDIFRGSTIGKQVVALTRRRFPRTPGLLAGCVFLATGGAGSAMAGAGAARAGQSG